jgi:hypothetical protein
MLGLGLALGLKPSVARSPGLSNNGLTNLMTFPQNLDNVAWGLIEATVTANTGGLAPDGTTTAEKVIPSTNNIAHGIYQAGAFGAGTFTFSAYAKAAGYPRLGLRVFDGAAYQLRATFDISAGSIVSTEAGVAFITSVGNGWYFIGCRGTTAANMGTTTGWVLEPLNAGSVVQGAFAGDGTSGALLWQVQVVAGSSPGPIVYG